MKKKILARFYGLMFVVLLGSLLPLTDTYGADSKKQAARKSFQNQTGQISKTGYRRVRSKTADPSSFKPDMPFSEAIDILRNSTVPPLNIAVLWKDLQENADIHRETPIGMDGLSKVPLSTHLKILLMSVSAGGLERLGYVVDDGVVIIATQSSLPRKTVTRIYDVSDLVAEPANYGQIGRMLGMQNMMMGGMMRGGMMGSGMMGGGMFGGGMMGSGMMGGGMMSGGAGSYGGRGFLGSGPYRSTGRAYIGTNSLRSNSNSNNYAPQSAVAYRSRELVDLIETLYGFNR